MRAANKGKPAIILLAEDDRGDQELTWQALEEGKIRNEQEQNSLGYRGSSDFFDREKIGDPGPASIVGLVISLFGQWKPGTRHPQFHGPVRGARRGQIF